MKIPFFGASLTDESPAVAVDELVNLYAQVVESGSGKSVGSLRGTPGYKLFAQLPTGAVRGLWSGEGRLFAASGNHAFEIKSDGYHDLGVIDNGPYNNVNTPVEFFPNGTQLMIVSNGHVYVYTGTAMVEPDFIAAAYDDLVIDAAGANVVTSASLPFDQTDKGMSLVITGGTGFTPATYTILWISDTGQAVLSADCGTIGSTGGVATETPGAVTARSAAFLDSYGIVAPAPNGSPGDPDYQSGKNFYISAPNNFLSWDAIDVASKEGYPDNIAALQADHEQLYVFGDLESTEVYTDTGNADFPFERNMGAFMHYGLAAQYSIARLGFNGLVWLTWSAGRGNVQAVFAQGSSPQRISTHALEAIWRKYPTVSDAVAYSYIEDGHQFWVINFPSGDATWVYDYTASQQMGKPMWHQRGEWDGSVLHRQRGMCHAFGYIYGITATLWNNQPVHFVGDYQNGNVYVQDLIYGDNNGTDVMRRRTCSHVSNEELRTFWSKFQLDMEVGDEPMTATLDVSKDHGHTFVNPRDRTVTAGDHAQRMIWFRLGAARDMVLRITIIGQSKVYLIDGYAEAQAGVS